MIVVSTRSVEFIHQFLGKSSFKSGPIRARSAAAQIKARDFLRRSRCLFKVVGKPSAFFFTLLLQEPDEHITASQSHQITRAQSLLRISS